MVISMSFARVRSLVIILLIAVLSLHVSAALYCEADIEDKRIALTFDDGPHRQYTAQILDILKKYNIKATFFTVGTNVEKFPELIEREINEGHEVANHTYSHKHMAELGESEFVAEILGWEDALNGHHEYTSELFRPPEGILTDKECEVIKTLGYDIVLWSVDTRDWAHNSVENIVNTVTANVQNGSIVLFHDFVSGGSTPTPEALEQIIPVLKEKGYEFVTVSELIK